MRPPRAKQIFAFTWSIVEDDYIYCCGRYYPADVSHIIIKGE